SSDGRRAAGMVLDENDGEVRVPRHPGEADRAANLMVADVGGEMANPVVCVERACGARMAGVPVDRRRPALRERNANPDRQRPGHHQREQCYPFHLGLLSLQAGDCPQRSLAPKLGLTANTAVTLLLSRGTLAGASFASRS